MLGAWRAIFPDRPDTLLENPFRVYRVPVPAPVTVAGAAPTFNIHDQTFAEYEIASHDRKRRLVYYRRTK